MGKKDSGAAQRAKKKHAKDVKRKKAVAKKPRNAPPPDTAARIRGWKPVDEGLEGLAHRTGYHFYSAAVSAVDIAAALGVALPEAVWTIPRVAALSTPALLARLAELGIATDLEAFVALSAPLDSAVRLAEEAWFPLRSASPTLHDRDFARLAACELWKRFCTETPSAEGRLDLYRLVMERAEAGDEPATVVAWLDLWAVIRARLTPEIRTIAAIDALFGSLFKSFDDWIELLAGAAEIAGESDPGLALRAADALREISEQLSEQDGAWKERISEDEGALRSLARAEIT